MAFASICFAQADSTETFGLPLLRWDTRDRPSNRGALADRLSAVGAQLSTQSIPNSANADGPTGWAIANPCGTSEALGAPGRRPLAGRNRDVSLEAREHYQSDEPKVHGDLSRIFHDLEFSRFFGGVVAKQDTVDQVVIEGRR